MTAVLLALALVSEASGQRFQEDPVHGGEPNRAPRGPRRSIAEVHARAFDRARGAVARREAVEAAELALTNARYAPKRDLVSGTVEWRLAIAGDPRPAPVVAAVYGVSRQHVYRLRARKADRAAG